MGAMARRYAPTREILRGKRLEPQA
jgi:hypothetical protein